MNKQKLIRLCLIAGIIVLLVILILVIAPGRSAATVSAPVHPGKLSPQSVYLNEYYDLGCDLTGWDITVSDTIAKTMERMPQNVKRSEDALTQCLLYAGLDHRVMIQLFLVEWNGKNAADYAGTDAELLMRGYDFSSDDSFLDFRRETSLFAGKERSTFTLRYVSDGTEYTLKSILLRGEQGYLRVNITAPEEADIARGLDCFYSLTGRNTAGAKQPTGTPAPSDTESAELSGDEQPQSETTGMLPVTSVYGRPTDDGYVNDYFGYSLSLPENWSCQYSPVFERGEGTAEELERELITAFNDERSALFAIGVFDNPARESSAIEDFRVYFALDQGITDIIYTDTFETPECIERRFAGRYWHTISGVRMLEGEEWYERQLYRIRGDKIACVTLYARSEQKLYELMELFVPTDTVTPDEEYYADGPYVYTDPCFGYDFRLDAGWMYSREIVNMTFETDDASQAVYTEIDIEALYDIEKLEPFDIENSFVEERYEISVKNNSAPASWQVTSLNKNTVSLFGKTHPGMILQGTLDGKPVYHQYVCAVNEYGQLLEINIFVTDGTPLNEILERFSPNKSVYVYALS